MAATSGLGTRLQGSRASVTGADNSLESINTFELDDGATVIIISNLSLYLLNKASTDAPVGDDIVAPAQGGPGRWFKYPIGGGGGSGEPLSNVLFADLETIVPLADQNGAIILPFSTADVLIPEVESLPSEQRTGYLTPGDYSANVIDLAVSARYAAFVPTYEGIRQSRGAPPVVLALNPTDDITIQLWGIDLNASLLFVDGEAGLEGDLFLEDCRTGNVSVFDIAAVNTDFNDATELNFGRGFMKDCSISSDAPTQINISEETFVMLGMSLNTNHDFAFLNAPGIITVDEITAATMVAASVTVTNGTVVVLELEQLTGVFYVDSATAVPTYLQNGAQGMPFSSLATALDAVTDPAEPTFIITDSDFSGEGPLTIGENSTLQAIHLPTFGNAGSSNPPPVIVDSFVVEAGNTLSLEGIDVTGSVTLGDGCQLNAISSGVAAATGTLASAANFYFRDCWLGGIDTGDPNAGAIVVESSTVDGNLDGGAVTLRSVQFQPGFTITCDNLVTDVSSYTAARMAGVTVTFGTITFTDGPVPFESGAETGVVAPGTAATVTFLVPGIIPPAKAVVNATNFPGLVGVVTCEPCGIAGEIEVTIRNFDAAPFDEELFICGLWFHDPQS